MKLRSSVKIAAGLFAVILVSGISAQASTSNGFERVAPDPLIVSTVPEPGTLTLLAVAGVGGLALALRRRRKD